MNKSIADIHPIVVYGASGYTGSLVAKELLRRGFKVVLSGRSETALHQISAELDGISEVRAVELNDPASLRAVLRGCSAVINCAGPFSETADPLVSAAIAVGVHYLDTSAEQPHARRMFEVHDGPARQAGVTLLPAAAFYNALGDLMAHAVSAEMGALEEVTSAYGVRGWNMTRGSRVTAVNFMRDRIGFSDGRQHRLSTIPKFTRFEFPHPLGRKRVIVDYPLGEPITVPRHTDTKKVTCLMSEEAFADGFYIRLVVALGSSIPLLAPLLRWVMRRRRNPRPEQIAGSDFVIEIRVRSTRATRRGTIFGADIYGISAIIIAEAAMRLLGSGGVRSGTLSAAEAFDSRRFLDALANHGVRYEIDQPIALVVNRPG